MTAVTVTYMYADTCCTYHHIQGRLCKNKTASLSLMSSDGMPHVISSTSLAIYTIQGPLLMLISWHEFEPADSRSLESVYTISTDKKREALTFRQFNNY